MKQKKITIGIFIMLCALFTTLECYCQNANTHTVKLKGKLLNWEQNPTSIYSKTVGLDFGLMNQIDFVADEGRNFDFSFELNKPEYFQIGRNEVYLSPGDDLDVVIDGYYPYKSTFKGKGAEANEYLKTKPHAKSGSYLDAGALVKDTHIETIVPTLNEKKGKRKELLQNLSNVSDEFRQLEQARIQLDHINSLLSYPLYAMMKDIIKDDKKLMSEMLIRVKDELNEESTGLSNNLFMQMQDFRDILFELVSDDMKKQGIFASFEATPEMKDYIALSSEYYKMMDEGISATAIQGFEDFKSKLGYEYRFIINGLVQKYKQVLPGNSATDFTMHDLEGTIFSLKDYKGKIICIDVWATWCGPCIQQAPYFHKIKEKYKANKDIVFLAVSIDTNIDKWTNYCKRKNLIEDSYIVNSESLKNYHLTGVPRFIIIDKEFKIADAFAPRPSEPQFEELIQKQLSRYKR